MIELAEARLEHLPVDQAGELHQRVAQVDLLSEARAPEVLGASDRAGEAASESPDINVW
jgi:hypothetical protein